MASIRENVMFCLRGHREFSGSFCLGCDDGLPPQFIPMRLVTYDLGIHEGRKNSSRHIILIPEDFIQDGEVTAAFERFTGFHRVHMIEISTEENREIEGAKLDDRLA